jgi:hypothetical protein
MTVQTDTSTAFSMSGWVGMRETNERFSFVGEERERLSAWVYFLLCMKKQDVKSKMTQFISLIFLSDSSS